MNLRNLLFLSVTIILYLSNTCFGQDTSFVWFESNKELELNGSNKSYSTVSSHLDTVLNKYDIVKIVKISPNELGLENNYVLGCFCNIDSLIYDFDMDSSLPINFIEKVPVGIEYDYTPNDYLFNGQILWHLDKINAKDAWDISLNYTDNIVSVGVSDAGFHLNHEDLTSEQIIQVFSNTPSSDPNNKNHGSYVAGVIASNTNNNIGISSIAGLNSKLELYYAGSSQISVERMFNMAKAGTHQIINASWHTVDGYGSQVNEHKCSAKNMEQKYIDKIYKMGIVVFAAAGNSKCGEGDSQAEQWPAAYNHVIAVANTKQDDLKTGQDQAGYASSYYAKVDISAPGKDIYTVRKNAEYPSQSGTSMSSPLVAGVAALMLSVNPCLHPDDVEYILETTADDIYSIPGNANYIGKLGAGRVNAAAAVAMAETYPITATYVSSGQTLTVADDFYRNGGYVVENGGTLIFESGTDNYMCRGGGLNILVERGGQLYVNSGATLNLFQDGIISIEGEMTIENGALINLNDESMISVENGGQLVWKNNFDANGINLKSDNAILQIEGNLHVNKNVLFDLKGSGKLVFGNTGTMTFGINSGIFWNMNSEASWNLEDGTRLLIVPPVFNINNGHFFYDNLSTLEITCNDIEISNSVLNPKSIASHIQQALILNTTYAEIKNTSFIDADKALIINAPFTTNPPTNSTILLDACSFDNHSSSAIESYYVTSMDISNSNILNSGFGIKTIGQSVNVDADLNLSFTSIQNCNTGISAGGIYSLNLTNESFIYNCNVGIGGVNTNLNIRNRSQVNGCNFGINLDSGDPNTHRLITIGDEGCGWVINNNRGINGINMLLNADAVSNNPSSLDKFYTNRFDGNTKIATLCYSSNAPNTVFLRGAYYGGIDPNSSTEGIDVHNTCIGQSPATKILVVTNEECLNQPADCNCPSDPYPPLSIISPLDSIAIYAQCVNPDDGENFADEFVHAYATFIERDYVEAKETFREIAENEYLDNLPPITPIYNYPCEHQIRVSEILAEVNSQPSARKAQEEEEYAAFVRENTARIKVIPNPSSGNVSVEFKLSENSSYSTEVYDPTAKEILFHSTSQEGKKGVNTKSLDLSGLQNGFYYLRVNSTNSSHIEKLVISR